jgi:hypothetical protein
MCSTYRCLFVCVTAISEKNRIVSEVHVSALGGPLETVSLRTVMPLIIPAGGFQSSRPLLPRELKSASDAASNTSGL